ncbi:hypothetical protein BM221_003748 [Beauveria bassiana]|uniref:Uncharacterized protein n=1 Tax=Beauveria bassiana TaxID=176275 RepID=A0A2N6NVI7_BEABA|nr:hypothetical protein BM221_003748 [Beauveria bassiana]
MKIIQDYMPASLKKLEQSDSEGFVANKSDEKAQLVRREGWVYAKDQLAADYRTAWQSLESKHSYEAR